MPIEVFHETFILWAMRFEISISESRHRNGNNKHEDTALHIPFIQGLIGGYCLGAMPTQHLSPRLGGLKGIVQKHPRLGVPPNCRV